MKHFFAAILRPLFGYKYKIVYTETVCNAYFKKRYMAKLPINESNSYILNLIPKPFGDRYNAPVTLYYSKTKTGLNTRHLLTKIENPLVVFEAYFK